MTDRAAFSDAVGRLRGILARVDEHRDLAEIVQARDEVLARFGPVFSPEHIAQLEEAEVKAFLRFENNKHWGGLHRQGNRICADMDALRRALAVLLDESQPLPERLNYAADHVHGLGKAIVTAILLVAYPSRYGVWNNISEAALVQLGLWPKFDRGASFGQRYEQINGILRKLAAELHTDLWTLDGLWWALGELDESGDGTELPVDDGSAQRFGLERHLHEFLRDNWDRTELGREWKLYEVQGDPEAGYKYTCGVGEIDLLARHKHKPDWLVVELKRDQTGDATVGQVLRYMGWVRKELAAPDEPVRGLIIARDADEKLLYALAAVADVELQFYEVEFHLRPGKGLNA